MKRIKRIDFSDHFFLQTGIDKDRMVGLFNKLPKDAKLIGFGRSYNSLESYMFFESREFEEIEDYGNVPILLKV